MGAIQISDAVQRLIEREVAAGRAASVTAFVEEAALRLAEDARLEAEEIAAVAAAGIADIEAGRFVTVSTEREHEDLAAELKAGLRARLAGED